ncbi:hypothetical protein [Leptolyngbya sp. FACHB-261]|uniref:hypothetical protein n=1 Tax=Leptolyngbya sp. FACHB-261 TaxID=2692806 RepID=UPI00168644C5|nr:hypothetical protein [Leptolyngbya sp. FACHB-261]MBD2101735.1 hypothetical protein [Leptolyngbya sp. FACHB-261]
MSLFLLFNPLLKSQQGTIRFASSAGWEWLDDGLPVHRIWHVHKSERSDYYGIELKAGRCLLVAASDIADQRSVRLLEQLQMRR